MTQENSDQRNVQQLPPPAKTVWQENHGNLLMGFVAVVLLIGGSILIYRQNRFVPPRFPDANMIATPGMVKSETGKKSKPVGNAVRINVTGAANSMGLIRIAVYDSKSAFNDPAQAIATESLTIVDGEASCEILLEQLPAQLAIAAFHDENSDNELNRNRLSIPTERYGFSNNARGLTGPPDFEQAVIRRPKPGETIDLSIR